MRFSLLFDEKHLKSFEGFPGGSVIKGSVNTEDMGSIPGPGRTHMPRATKPCARAEPVLKGMGATTTEPVAASTDICMSRAGTPQQGMQPQPEARILPGRSSLRSLQ